MKNEAIKYHTMNVDKKEYWTVKKSGKINTTISVFDCNGFIRDEQMPTIRVERYKELSKNYAW